MTFLLKRWLSEGSGQGQTPQAQVRALVSCRFQVEMH